MVGRGNGWDADSLYGSGDDAEEGADAARLAPQLAHQRELAQLVLHC